MESLPTEVAQHIVSYCTLSNRLCLSLTSRSLYNIVKLRQLTQRELNTIMSHATLEGKLELVVIVSERRESFSLNECLTAARRGHANIVDYYLREWREGTEGLLDSLILSGADYNALQYFFDSGCTLSSEEVHNAYLAMNSSALQWLKSRYVCCSGAKSAHAALKRDNIYLFRWCVDNAPDGDELLSEDYLREAVEVRSEGCALYLLLRGVTCSAETLKLMRRREMTACVSLIEKMA